MRRGERERHDNLPKPRPLCSPVYSCRHFSTVRLQSLGNLSELSLAGNSISDDSLKHLTKLPKLTILDLRKITITDDGLEHLKGIKTLAILHSDDAKGITEAGITRLKKALPQLLTKKPFWWGLDINPGLRAILDRNLDTEPSP